MRIGINTLFLVPNQVGGSEIYIRQLINKLAQIDSENEYVLFVGEHNQAAFSHLPFANIKRIFIESRFAPWLPVVLQRGLEQINWLNSVVSRQIMATDVDLVHYPGTTIEPMSLPLPCVLTIHDIQQEYYPQFFPLRERIRRNRFYQASANKAEMIIAVSEFTRQTLLEKYSLSPDKVRTIHSGVSHEFFSPIEQCKIEQVRQKYDLPKQFALFPAKAWPHKNHQCLFKAMRVLKSKYRVSCKLVLSGLSKEDFPNHLQHLLETELADTVLILGYIPEPDLKATLQMATLVVYPSLFEGFGLPVLEAMASGCPVVCSNRTALPEIAGDAAILVDPLNIDALATAIHRVLIDIGLRSDLIKLGLARAKQFSWEATARATLQVYQETYTRLHTS